MSETGKEWLQRLLFHALLILAGYLTYLVLSPFLTPLAWAAVFATLLHSEYLTLAGRVGPNRAATLTTIMTALLIVAPAVTLVSWVAQEIPQVIDYMQKASNTAPSQLERVWAVVRDRSPFDLPEDPMLLIQDALRRLLTFLAPRAGAILANLFGTLGSLFVMLFALFFMLRDGERLAREVRDLLPLPKPECERLLRETRDLVVASVGAGVLVAIAQGAIGGVAFWAVGIAAPAVWGVVMAFASLIPVVGAALVWVPAAIGLLVSGHVSNGVILAVVGVLGISMADNILRPLFLSGRTAVSGMVIFFGLLGGVSAFGFIGIVLGPIILVTTGRLLKMFSQPTD